MPFKSDKQRKAFFAKQGNVRSNVNPEIVKIKTFEGISPFNERGNVKKLINTYTFKLHQKAIKGKKLTQDEKDRIYQGINRNSFFKDSIPFQAVRFNFSKILKTYFVQFNTGDIQQVKAINKTSIRNEEMGVNRIVEVK